MWKGVIEAQFGKLSRLMCGGTEENYGIPQFRIARLRAEV
jgi:hypothetical protein